MALLATIPKKICQVTFVLGFFLLFVSARIPVGFDSSRGSILMVPRPSFGARPILKANDERVPVQPGYLDPPQVELYSQANPYNATILEVTLLANEPNYQVCNIKIEHDGNIPAWEGMCYKAVNLTNTAQYSYFCLASTRYGDDFDGNTATLCVKRVGKITAYMCDAARGYPIGLAGPYFRNMLLAQDNPFATQIMVATETGIGPFRGYLRRMFVEEVPFKFQGVAWLIFGAHDNESVLYDEELSDYANEHPSQFKYDKSVNASYGVCDIIQKYIVEIYNILDKDGIISFSGREDMMPLIENVFWKEAARRGENWPLKLQQLIQTNKWRQIVYHFGDGNGRTDAETYIKAI